MDANGTRFQLVLGEHDWTRRMVADPAHPEAPAAQWDATRQELTLRRELFRFPSSEGTDPVAVEDRRGADRDRFGTVYWIDEERTAILAQAPGSAPVRFWPAERAAASERPAGAFAACAPGAPAAPLQLGALAVTTTHYLVAGTLDPGALLVFDLQTGGPPRRSAWPVPFAPFDAAALPDGGVAVLDRAGRRLWLLDRWFGVRPARPAGGGAPPGPEPGDFAPLAPSGEPAPPPPRRIALDDALALDGDPVAVVALPDDSLLVLDRNGGAAPPLLRRLRDGAPLGRPVALGADAAPPLALVAHDMALAPGAGLGTLYVADAAGDQAYAFALGERDGELTAVLQQRYLPMRQFGGKGLLGPRGSADDVLYDFAGGWVPLVEQCRPRYATDGWLVTPEALDGHEPGCVWHRLMLDADIPPGCAVEVWSRAADEPAELELAEWSREPAPLRRPDGPDRPYLRQPDPYATHELLFQRARGRWLQLRLHLAGDGRSTPRLHALRALYPRFSYLERYLPAVYREDPESASFLDRFLANVEGIATTLEDRVAAAQVLLDPRAAPVEGLDWLASFFDVALDPVWSERRRRAFVARAMELFRWRGTPHGLRIALRLALDAAPEADEEAFALPERAATRGFRVLERFRLSAPDPNAPAGERLGAHRFTVLLPMELGERQAGEPDPSERRELARRIVELQKPAHTAFDVRFYWSAFRVGEARIGEGTVIGLGSRSPQLLRPAVLGAGHAGESVLAGPHGPLRPTDPDQEAP